MREFFEKYESDRQVLLREAEAKEAERKKNQYLDVKRWITGRASLQSDSEPESESSLIYHREFQKVREEFPDTCTWILKDDKMSAWMNADTPMYSILWMSAKKGAGKTTLE